MKIVATSINPLFADQVIGGSTKHLRNVAVKLAEDGHEVTVLCTGREDTAEPFHWHERAEVLPVLRHKQPFPGPYEIPGYRMAQNIQTVADHLVDADRFYIHDGEFLFPAVAQDVPTVVSLRDNVYPETMLGSYLFRGDTLITIADYSREVVIAGPGRFLRELPERTVTIPNGIDFDRFRRKRPAPALADLVPAELTGRTVVLHPHRPERSKGLPQTIAVADQLVHRHGFDDLLVLVPRWFDADKGEDTRAFQREMETAIAERGLTGHVLFHDWIPQSLMPDYFNSGHLTLALGHFVEAFGNTPYESLACGTPTITARVATHRTLVPDDLLEKVHFGDIEGTAVLAARLLREGAGVPEAVTEHLRTHYDVADQLDAYAEAILGAVKRPEINYRFDPLTPDTTLRLAPWCYEWGDAMFWHDFSATHTHLPQLSRALAEHPGGLPLGAHPHTYEWYEAGYVVP